MRRTLTGFSRPRTVENEGSIGDFGRQRCLPRCCGRSKKQFEIQWIEFMADEQMPPVAVSQQKDIRIVEFQNQKILDEANIADIGASLNSLIDELTPPKLLLDFVNVDHLSSAALGMLINANNRIKAKNGALRLANIKSNILEVFVITKLNKLFKILPTRDEALASF
jgi:anti-sigma B factor antagonist